ncbi:uncharacterized protein LOC142765570 isoform X2 [Rhipicephalus microplus]|uniref:uncharacterized protein LOC142765570 isoform X2 n=1 Tax=Rhipicephalus microplus TaxID=6941 RepID=UPI003F6BCA24
MQCRLEGCRIIGTQLMLALGLAGFFSFPDNSLVPVSSQSETMASWPSDKVFDTFKQRILGCLPGNKSIFPEVSAIEVTYEAFKQHQEEHDPQLSEMGIEIRKPPSAS